MACFVEVAVADYVFHGIRKIGSAGPLFEKVVVTGIGGHQEV